VNVRRETALALLISLEIWIFALIAPNFATLGNAAECLRTAIEIGLLAVAMTPVIITGGIDLSVGSMMGLSSVVLGMAWHDAGWPIATAIAAALGVGLLGGLLNAMLIARLNASPLIVTLGTYSLFRGIAEGATGGARSFSGFPPRFLFIGQGYLAGALPAQALLFVCVVALYWIVLRRTVIGRALYAIGLSPAGARYAGLPVTMRLLLVYACSGIAAAAAAVIYVARIGQAKADAGLGYELSAITAVVLGGTSIFGGSGGIGGTLLGLAAIVILQNGFRLAALPTEAAGVATGVLLLLTIVVENLAHRWPVRRQPSGRRRWLLRGAVSAAVILVAAVPWFARNLDSGAISAHRRITVAMMPKSRGDPYFVSCRAGAEEAQRELGVTLIWDGPTEVDPAKQNEFVETWITRRVDAIAVSVGNAASISTVLRKARAAGIKVLTWDADAEPDARDYFINQATPQEIAETLVDRAAEILHRHGEIAIVTGALTAANQNLWIDFMKQRLRVYPDMKLDVIRPSDDDRDKAFAQTQTILRVYPRVGVLVGISAPAVPGMAEAVKQSGQSGVKVIGLSLPALCRPYVHDGVLDAVVLWKTRDLGYLTVTAAAALARGDFPRGAPLFNAGRLGRVRVQGTEIILGKPVVFDRTNIDAAP
jgi:ribose/xylose/arabinose/galactoside ABC-type transport system permease subunit/ABC-type sugar transport system substrate-binding protein